MRATDLDHEELLDLDAKDGLIRFGGERALLLDAVAMGILRKHLVETFGLEAARTLLTQFGFAHGWRMADAMHAQFEWDSDLEWCRAGARVHALGGLFGIDPIDADATSRDGATIRASYEAEQHLLHFGRSDAPMCWTICGLMSGYISRSTGRETFVFEDRCEGKGDGACHLFGRTREQWGPEHADELRFFEPNRLKAGLEVPRHRVTDSLLAAERKLREHTRAIRRVAVDVEEPLGMITKSVAIRALVDLAKRVAKVDSTVLITGESGAGKERVARLIHDESARVAGPFIAVNCGAVAETLLESELFGHARGAFTGAGQDRAGLFEAANGGTLLLDEIGEVSITMQVKLLRAVQEREIRRVGENKTRKVDVRIVAATNRDLAQEVTRGAFRQDLYYRLKVVELNVPALRERRDDLLALARVLLAEAALRMKRDVVGLAPGAAELLLRYEWPGNVRELANAMERAVALARGTRVEIEDLPIEIRADALPAVAAVMGAVRPLEDIEKDYILAALEQNGGNQTRTSEQLRIGSATLYRKLKSYGLIPDKRPPTGGLANASSRSAPLKSAFFPVARATEFTKLRIRA